MDNQLLTQINTEINDKEAFAEWFGMPLSDIPQEILDEAFTLDDAGERAGAARAGERDWVRDLAAKRGGEQQCPSTYRNPLGGAPESMPRHTPQVGDFVVVGGKPVKVVDSKTMFGGQEFVYLQGMQKPIITSRLQVDKRVGKVNVYSIKK